MGDSKRRKKRALARRYGCKCLACGLQMHAHDLTIDHVVPKALGGADSFYNMQLLCSRCNYKKGQAIVDYRPAKLNPYATSTALAVTVAYQELHK
jgi:5-methylcytosine-specific restriction endonuclease McrA